MLNIAPWNLITQTDPCTQEAKHRPYLLSLLMCTAKVHRQWHPLFDTESSGRPPPLQQPAGLLLAATTSPRRHRGLTAADADAAVAAADCSGMQVLPLIRPICSSTVWGILVCASVPHRSSTTQDGNAARFLPLRAVGAVLSVPLGAWFYPVACPTK